MNVFIPVLFMVCPLAALLFLVHFGVSLLFPKVADERRRHPLLFTIWGCFGFVGLLVFSGILSPTMWPPRFLEHRQQRAELLKRIRSAGGWAALQKDCEALVGQNRDDVFRWTRGSDTNALPHAIAVLNPLEVQFYSPAVLQGFKDAPQVPVLHIRVFGIHSTGGHSIPYFGLAVACGTNAGSYRPSPSHGGVIGNRFDSYRQVTDTIYEIY
jgi:hypothetical protein